MAITIGSTSPENDIKVERGMFDALVITQGDDIIYVTEDMIKLFVSAVNAVAKDILGEAVE